ncbi:hypothetical protein O3M35_011442 [Rhynocoris fuscipes]|uniref:Uncharacterized protein n=1 Tax=Rhynocoris fuscipes TaxID=488301 RepID=A0AAW1CWL8_9HEMI
MSVAGDNSAIMFTILVLILFTTLVSGNSLPRLKRHDQRFVSTLRDAEHRTSCPYSFHLDINEDRLPKVIEKVKCYSIGRYCPLTEAKTSCCTEILTEINVHYIKSGISKNETFPIGCACVQWPSVKANTIAPPLIV